MCFLRTTCNINVVIAQIESKLICRLFELQGDSCTSLNDYIHTVTFISARCTNLFLKLVFQKDYALVLASWETSDGC
jgi:hypothetical protein